MRNTLKTALNEAILARNTLAASTLRLVLAAIKDRDIAARGQGKLEGVSDDEILALLASMVKQRRESAEMFEQGGRVDLYKQEIDEIAIIEGFLPQPLVGQELHDAIAGVVAGAGATSLRDMGKVMSTLKQQYPGQLDMVAASGIVKRLLTA